jgi:hypothetical protein
MNGPQQTQSQQSLDNMVHICVVQEGFPIMDELAIAPKSMLRIFEKNVDSKPVVLQQRPENNHQLILMKTLKQI